MKRTKGDRIIKSESARRKRKTTKHIKENILENYYSKMRSLRKKLSKIKERHHDKKI